MPLQMPLQSSQGSAQHAHQSKGNTRMAKSLRSNHWFSWSNLRGVLGGWQTSSTAELFRGVVYLWNWRVGELEIVSEGLSFSSGDTRTRKAGAYFADRHGNSGNGDNPTTKVAAQHETVTRDTGRIAVQITRGESATAILKQKLTNAIRATTTFIMANILLVGGLYELVLKVTFNSSLTHHELSFIAGMLVASNLLGMATIWLVQNVHVEGPVVE